MKNYIRILVLISSTSSWAMIDLEQKIQTVAISYHLPYGAEAEVRVYAGLSVFARFAYLPDSLLEIEDYGKTAKANQSRFSLGLRYYITGNPLEDGLYIQYSPSISKLNAPLYLNIHSHGQAISNSLDLGYRLNFTDSTVPIFCDLQLGVASNFVSTKDPSSLGSLTNHQWTPSGSISVGIAF